MLGKVGKKQSGSRLAKAILQLRGLFNFGRRHIGGNMPRMLGLSFPLG